MSAAVDYVRAGLALVPIPAGTKGPRTTGWNTEAAAIRSEDQAAAIASPGVGLAHRWCRTCAIDIDDVQLADTWLAAHGINLTELLSADDAVQVRSPKPNRAKLLYRLPDGVEWLPSLNRGGDAGLELRCATTDGALTVQDVLPPTIHPEMGKPYQWGGLGTYRALPPLPAALLTLWRELARRERPVPAATTPRPTGAILPKQETELVSALACISPENRDDWLRVGMALHSTDAPNAFGLWCNWSQRSDKFDAKDQARVWESFNGHAGPAVQLGTVFAMAAERGWVNPMSKGASLAEHEDPSGAALTKGTRPADERRALHLSERQPPLIVCDAFELLAKNLPPREVLLSPWLQSQSLNMVYAWRGVGKTHVALGIAYALASGGEFLGWKATRAVPVLYIDGEMPGPALKDRIARIVAGSPEEAAPGSLRFITPDLQRDRGMPNLSESEGQAEIDSVIGNAEVIVVDNISCLVRGGKENEGESWQPVADWALKKRAAGKSVIFIHHTGKTGQQRGTSKREDLLDTSILLKRPSDYKVTEGARFEVHFEKFRACPDGEVRPFEARLETDARGNQAWTVRTVDSIADAQMIELAELGISQAEIAREIGCNRSTVLRALRKAEAEGRYTSPKPKAKLYALPKARGRDDD